MRNIIEGPKYKKNQKIIWKDKEYRILRTDPYQVVYVKGMSKIEHLYLITNDAHTKNDPECQVWVGEEDMQGA